MTIAWHLLDFPGESFSMEPLPAEGGVTYSYKKRARDSGAVGVYYVYWTAANRTDPYPGAPPFGGPLVEDTVIAIRMA